MRNHLHHCLKNGVFVEFPVLRISRKISKVTKTVSVPIYCYCRMPDKGGVLCVMSGTMWDCVLYLQKHMQKKSMPWYCNNCIV